MTESYEIIWHGRGGQGAVTAAKILTEAAHFQGFKGVSAKPAYFSERRGAPVSVHARISREPIRTFSNVVNPDIAVILDDNLLDMINVTANLKPGGLLVVNSAKSISELAITGFDLAISDAFHASEKAGLIIEGNVLISTSILGAFAAACDLISLDNIKRAVEHKFSGNARVKNLAALDNAFHATQVLRFKNPVLSAIA